MRARLLGLVLIPSIGLAVIAGGQVREHSRLADEARGLAVAVDDAALALDAFVATTQEYRLSEISRQALAYGVPLEVAAEMLEVDLVGSMARARARVDVNPLVPGLLEELGGVRRLRSVRAQVDAGLPVRGIMPDLVTSAEQAWLDQLAGMVRYDTRARLGSDLRRALHAFQTSAELFQIANQQLLLVSDKAVPGSAVRRADTDDIDIVAARYQVGLERAVADADEHLDPVLQRIVDDHGFDDAVRELGVKEGRVIEVGSLAALFRPGLDRNAMLEDLTEASSADARTHAIEVGEDAEARFSRTLALIAGIVLATLALALVVARSLARPLSRLARRAAEISDGELDGPRLPQGGPREAAVLARTLNDAVDNLRAVERQMSALAAGDLVAAAGASAPGKLGTLVGRSVTGLARSLDERDQLQKRLSYDATHDALTGLANRRTAMARLDELLQGEAPVGLLYIDLDGFKLVNDEQGHAAGDELLTIAAHRLRDGAPAGSLVARLGGDEFVVACESTEQESLVLARRLADALAQGVVLDDSTLRVAASVGVAVSRPGDDADRLLRSADAALYRAKRAGRGAVVALDDRLRAALEAEHQLEVDLRVAIAADQLELHYQPVFEAAGGLHGVEALVRWRRPDGTLVPPDDFIPAAERSGLVIELDRWVLRRGLEQLARWRNGRLPGLRLSVNASANTLLSPRLVHDVGTALARCDLPGEALLVEVTETALLHDLDTAAANIAELGTLGVCTSVDDFGTGYTSVSHLRRLPVTEVKIDRSFIQAMGTDDRDRELVDLVVRIGDALGLDVVAEGVETEEQLEAVRALGCRYAQGYLLGRPMRAPELEAAHGAPVGRALTAEGAPGR